MKKHRQKLEEKIQSKHLNVVTFSKVTVNGKPERKERSATMKEKRIVDGMPPDVKKFYLEFKKNHPGRENEYYKAFVKMKQAENQKRLKEEEYNERLVTQLAKSIQNASFLLRTN